jgi:hypothetical protein
MTSPALTEEARDVHPAAVHLDVAVVHDLPRRERGRHELRAVHDGVEPALEEPDQVLAGIALHPDRFGVVAAELLLGDVGVIALQLLLGAQLRAEVGHLALAALSVLAGAVFATIDGALRAAPIFWPMRRSSLCFAAILFDIRVSSDSWIEERALLLPASLLAGRQPRIVSGARVRENERAAPQDRAHRSS